MSDLPRIPDAIDTKRLASMRQVAKMKEIADRQGQGFIGGFIDDCGQMFVMTNIVDPNTGLTPSQAKMRRFLEGMQ